MRIINNQQQIIVDRIRKLLFEFRNVLNDHNPDRKDIDLIDDAIFLLEDVFSIVVVGEYNAGKSAFINALLGENLVETGITPTTTKITILRYGENNRIFSTQKNQSIHEIPSELLKDLSVIDTPGTNAVIREHEALTKDFIPRSDLVIFVTSVDRPFTESERQFLETIKNWGKKIIFVINKIDIVSTDDDLNKARQFVSDQALKLLGMIPEIFTLSSKKALDAKLESNYSIPEMRLIEEFILNSLDAKNKLKIKLQTPLGIINQLQNKYHDLNLNRLSILAFDIQLLEDIDKQISVFREDMNQNFSFRYSEIDNSLLKFEKRGILFFESTFRLGKILDLLNKERIQNEYRANVIGNLSQEIDDKVNALIDWLVEEDLNQWQVITRKIDDRIVQYKDRVFDDPEARLIRIERQKIIQTVKREARRIMDSFDKDEESLRIAQDAQNAVAASAAIEAGAFGLGTLVTLLATTASADFTGVLLAGVTAVLGLFVIPARKKITRDLFSRNLGQLRNQLSTTLQDEFNKQVEYVIERIHSTIAPYSRFVKSENSKLKEFNDIILEISKTIIEINSEISSL